MGKMNVSKVKQHVKHATAVVIGAVSLDLFRAVAPHLLQLPLGRQKQEEAEPVESVVDQIIDPTHEQEAEEAISEEEHIHDACENHEHENHLFI